MRYIKRVSKVKNDDTKGYIINSTNVVDKEKNTYSANVIDELVEIKEITMTVEDGAEKSLFKGGRSGKVCYIAFRIDTKKQFNSWEKLATLSSNGGAFTYTRITGHYLDTSNANNVLLPLNLGPDGVISPIVNIPSGAEVHVCASYIGND